MADWVLNKASKILGLNLTTDVPHNSLPNCMFYLKVAHKVPV